MKSFLSVQRSAAAIICAACALSCGASAAAAADGISLYGLVDYGFIYAHRDNGVASDNNFQMESGKYTGSRFGMKGEEDLADGVKAGFILENGFSADSGSLNASSKLFDREAAFFQPFGNRSHDLGWQTFSTLWHSLDAHQLLST